MVAGDFGKDGKIDLAVTQANSNSLTVLLGNGNGTFGQPQVAYGYPETGALTLGDLNGDHNLDLLVVSAYDNTVDVVLGAGSAYFTGQTYTVERADPFTSTVSLSRATIDTNMTSTITLQARDEFGNNISHGGLRVTFRLSDIGTSGGTIGLVRDNGDGTYTATFTAISAGTPRSIVASIDGTPLFFSQPAITVTPHASLVAINLPSPGGSITTGPSVSFTVTFSAAVTGVVASDFVVTATGSVKTSPPVITPVSQSVYTVEIDGIAGAGSLGLNFLDNGAVRDLAGGPLQPTAATVGSFTAPTTYVAGQSAQSIVVADVNGDGKPDLVIDNVYSDVSVFLGNGNGTFQNQRTFAASGVEIAAVADVNGDGKPDLILRNGILFGTGSGNFSPEVGVPGGGSIDAVADINRDGFADLVVANSNNTVSVLLGNGNGTFKQTGQSFAVGLKPIAIAVADLNGDGNPDVVVSNENSDTVSVLLGYGDGSFQMQQVYARLSNSVGLT